MTLTNSLVYFLILKDLKALLSALFSGLDTLLLPDLK